MTKDETMLKLYEELANRYARQGEARMRDHCLVLAADAALSAEQPDQAERLRKRLLLTNPHHLLRPYGSMAEAMQSSDVRDYVIDLRRKWPPDAVEKLLREVPAKAETFDVGVAEPAPPKPPEMREPKKPKKDKKPALTLGEADAPVSVVSFGIVVLLFLVSVAAVGAGLYFALGGPFLE